MSLTVILIFVFYCLSRTLIGCNNKVMEVIPFYAIKDIAGVRLLIRFTIE